MAEPQAEKTTRDRLRDLLQSGMENSSARVTTNLAPITNQLGITPESTAALIMGGDKSPLPLGIGVADFVPFLGTALGTEEAIKGLKDAKESAQRGDYIGAGVDAAFGAVGLIPGAQGTAKYGRKAINAIRNIDLSKIPALMRAPTALPASQGMAGGGRAKALLKSALRPDLPAKPLKEAATSVSEKVGFKGTQDVLPAAERDANLAKFLEPSAVKTRMYHGTTSNVDKFDLGQASKQTGNPNAQLGHFFTGSPEEASRYATDFGNKQGSNVMPVYLNIKNPKRLTYKEMDDLAMAMFDKNAPVNDWKNPGFAERQAKRYKYAQDLSRQKRQELIDAGHDGAVVRIGGQDEYIAFHPEQIKSAIGNRGTYDINEADINKAKGGAVKKAVKEAVEGVVESVKPMVDRLNMHFKDVTKRVPELQEGAQRIKADELSRADYEKLVNKYKPVKPYQFIPKPATREEAINALTADKRDLYGAPSSTLQAGHPVGLRLDIPAYSDHGVWVPAVHQQDAGFGAGQRIGYENVAGVMNPTFGMSEKAALNIAAGKPKATIATIKGEWNPMDEATAVARAQEYLSHPDWVQVGMDPERHGYFYNRRSMEPVTAAEEAIQIGPLVLAKKPQYGKKSDFKFAAGGAIEMAGGGEAKTALKRAIGRGLDYIRSPKTSTSIVKEGGGNWPAGNVEGAMNPLKGRGPTEADREWLVNHARQNPQASQVGLAAIPQNEAINNWIDKQLTRYVKNQMGTKEDPIRALAEQGKLHVNPEQLNFRPEMHGKYLGKGQSAVAQSPVAKAWEGASDLQISPTTVGQLLGNAEDWTPKMGENITQQNPWLHKIPEETSVYGITDPKGMPEDLGFNHLIDELRNATNPASGLPRELLIKPESLSKLSVPQAVERVAKINEWRAAQKVEADLIRARNPATVMHKEYPEGYSWYELKMPEGAEDNKALADALKYEGEQMGHCVGGYCPDVAEGRSRIYSLRDKKGQPHVTVEVRPGKHPLGTSGIGNQFPHQIEYGSYADLQAPISEETRQQIYDLGKKLHKQVGGNPFDRFQDAADQILGPMPSEIVQIKGKSNRAPNPEYLPFVQEFVKSGNWSDVGDFGNTGLMRIAPESNEAFYLRQQNKPIPEYVTDQEYDEIRRGMASAMKSPYGSADEGMKKGGEVHMEKGGKAKGFIKSGLKNIFSETATPPRGVEPIVVRTPEERELKGAMRPASEPVRGQTSKELRAMQREQLNPEQKEKLSALKSQYPDFASASKFMMPDEIAKIIDNPRGVREMNSLLQVIPNAKEMASVAKTGEAKRGWYRASTQAIMNVFGDDAPRFSSLLAALSPQNSVETNLLNTLNTWKNWTAAGRPTDERSIREILGRSVQGTKGEESVLEAWIPNAIRSLSAQDPTKVVLSGAKVDSFWRNLADDVYRVTNDAWMANGMGIQQKLFGQKPTELQLRRGDPGLTPGYIGASARTREAGEMANMLPSEAQETTWSTFMPLYEMQETYNMPAREILQRGMLTPEAIRGTPDFSTLFHDPTYGRILEQSGYGEQLAGLRPHQWPEAKIDLSLSEQRDLERAAHRLEDLRTNRNMETRSKTISLPSEGRAMRAYPYETAEYIPMRGAGHAEEIIDAPMGQRQSFSSKMSGAFTDFTGKDVLHGALGLQRLKTAPGLGAYRPPGKYPWMTMPMENQPMFAIGVESPVTSSMDLPKRVHEKMSAAAALRGAMTGQGGQAYNAQIPSAGGSSLFVPLDKKVGAEEMSRSSQLLPPNVFLADTGRGVSVINYGNKFDENEAQTIAQRLGGQESIPATTRGDYIDYSSDWMQPQGSGAVTRKMLSNIEPLSASDLKSLSDAAQVPAGKVYDAYRALEENKGYVVREDLMRLLNILRNKGIPGVTAALAAGEALPSEPEQSKRAGGLACLKYGGGRA